MVDEAGAIVGGCIAGGVVFFFIIGILIYQLACKRKHRKRREQNKFLPVSPQASLSHSQPSTLGHDVRLPKVNSTGLWVGAQNMYTGVSPSPAYYYGPSKMAPNQAPAHPVMLQRASSEIRIPSNVPILQPRIFHSSQPLTPVFEIPPPSRASNTMDIYDVYQFDGGNSRSKLVEEKHSKNYHMETSKTNSRLGRSQSDIQGKSKKIISRHPRSRDSASRQAPNVSRSESATSKDRTPNSQHRKTRPAPAPPRPSSASAAIHQQQNRLSSSAPGNRIGMKSKSMDALDDNFGSRSSLVSGGHYNKGFDTAFVGGYVSSLSGDIIFKPAAPIPPKVATVARASSVLSSSTPRSDILPNGNIARSTPSLKNSKDKNSNDVIIGGNEVQVDTSATDSMKLLAKNKTDDQKTVVGVGKPVESPSPGVVSKLSTSTSAVNDAIVDDIINSMEDKDLSKGHIHYVYQGDIYAVPEKNTGDDGENPILSRLKEMVVEKTRTNSTKSVSSSREHFNGESGSHPPSRNNTPRSFISTSDNDFSIDNDYQEIGNIVKSMERENSNKSSENEKNAPLKLTNGNIQREVIESSNLQTALTDTRNSGRSSKSSHGTSGGNDVGSGDNTDTVDGGRIPEPTSPVGGKKSKAADTTFEEINNAGKEITAEAFEFLDTYLSDDEGLDGPASP